MKEQKKQTNKTKAEKKTVKKKKAAMTPKERRLANLKPFKAGQSGNPKGRPVGKGNWDKDVERAIIFMSEKLRADGQIGEDEVLDIHQQVLAQFFTKAINGNQKMMELFLERFYGKVSQDLNIGGNGNPIEAIVIPADTAEEVAQLRSKWRKDTSTVKVDKKPVKKIATKKIKFK